MESRSRTDRLWAIVRTGTVALCLIPFLFFRASQCAGQDKQALAKLDQSLKEIGIRRSGANLMLEQESQLKTNLATEKQIHNEWKKALPDFQAMELEDQRRALGESKALDRVEEIEQLLAQALPVTQHNQLVAERNTLILQINKKRTDKQWPELLKKSRARRNQILDRYIENLLDARKTADQLEEQWRTLESDEDFKQLVEELGVLLNQTVTPGPSRNFRLMISQLEKLEEKVLSDVIPLQSDGGNTFNISVTVNGKATVEMVLDSGAGIISLPNATAKEIGVEATSSSPDIQLIMADGNRVTAKLVSIPVVRVGRFEAKDVEAAILPPQLTNAEPLLGMSFLKNFQFKVDSDAKTLTMSEVGISDEPATNGAKVKSKKK